MSPTTPPSAAKLGVYCEVLEYLHRLIKFARVHDEQEHELSCYERHLNGISTYGGHANNALPPDSWGHDEHISTIVQQMYAGQRIHKSRSDVLELVKQTALVLKNKLRKVSGAQEIMYKVNEVLERARWEVFEE